VNGRPVAGGILAFLAVLASAAVACGSQVGPAGAGGGAAPRAAPQGIAGGQHYLMEWDQSFGVGAPLNEQSGSGSTPTDGDRLDGPSLSR
jgi:hypothetical protein